MIQRISEAGRPCGHISDERLGTIASDMARNGILPPEETHLFECERCFSAVAEFARSQMLFEDQQAQFQVPSDLMDEARRIPDMEIAGSGGETARVKRPRWKLPKLRWAAGLSGYAVGGAGIAVIALLALSPLSPWHSGAVDHALQLDRVDWSIQQMAVYGFEAMPLSAEPSLRSVNPRMTEELELLKPRYRATPDPDLGVRVVATALIAGRFEDARSYAIDAMRKFPDEPRLWVSRANIYRIEGELDQSEALLRNAVESSPEDEVARFNLGIVLLQRGDPAGGSLLEQIANGHLDTPLSRRAKDYLR